MKRLGDFDPPVHNIEDFFNHSPGIQAMSKKGYKNLEDRLDAFLCACAAYWLARHKGKVIGDDRDGFITIPVIDENEVRDSNSERINELSKQMRYGLPTKKSIIIYESEKIKNSHTPP